MSSPDYRPLWEALQSASVAALYSEKRNLDLPVSNLRIAAELRAIADEIERRDIDPLEIEDWLREEALNAEEGNE